MCACVCVCVCVRACVHACVCVLRILNDKDTISKKKMNEARIVSLSLISNLDYIQYYSFR